MNITEQMKTIPFLSTRIFIEDGYEKTVSIIAYRDSEDSPYSNIIACPQCNGIGAMVTLFTNGCMVKLDMNKLIITVNIPGDEPSIATFPLNVDEGGFFQETVLHDFKDITFEHLKAVRDVVELYND
ncbi:hypothetical protein SEPL_049 [Salmonella phage SE_PL]|uniref:hypothetical protein n=1 Tax=Salmonella enterica TaxID=28901 RepID=UPI0011630BF3|nr:hypothetical protein 7t3_0559 [Salmonella phage 7t3]QIG62662.1 hypothetical protein SEPL_049 [Salmonella phage SE_PL]WNV47485.1 hypothetical protein [Klebsiella phage fENko-Kae01]